MKVFDLNKGGRIIGKRFQTKECKIIGNKDKKIFLKWGTYFGVEVILGIEEAKEVKKTINKLLKNK